MLASILKSSKPELKEFVVHLIFPNTLMLAEVKKNQVHILNYLREKLQNYELSFNYILDEKTEQKYAYTPQEKFIKLQEINPLIAELRRKLHLDI